jgi:hypothetical protein
LAAQILSRRWDSGAAAKSFDEKLAASLEAIQLPPAHEYFRRLQSYLQRRTDERKIKGFAHLLTHTIDENDLMEVFAGPTIYRPGRPCLEFSSGAKLSFAFTLRRQGEGSRLVSYRFDLRLPEKSGLKFMRIDLNGPNRGNDPLHVPRSHLHPGFPHIHIPFPVMTPLEVLDRIFFVVEPALVP